jgi:light-regulated signal transduction histidine kinase (bacteriophytochrome)
MQEPASPTYVAVFMRDSSASSVDLTNCDREPIHLLGMVQPFGFLIAVSITDWLVERVSQNISQWVAAKPEDLLGKPIHEVIHGDAVHAIRGHLHSAIMGNTTARLFGLDLAEGLRCDVAVHLVENTVIIECEPSSIDPSFNAAATVQGMIARLLQTDNDRAFYRIAAREVRALTGFDRVMVYRFTSAIGSASSPTSMPSQARLRRRSTGRAARSIYP